MLVIALLLAAPVQTAPAAPSAAGSAKADSAKADPKVCRRIEETGSFTVRHECRPRSEWRAIDAANNAAADGARNGTTRGMRGARGGS